MSTPLHVYEKTLNCKVSLLVSRSLCSHCSPHEAALHQGHHLLPGDEPVAVDVIDLEAVFGLFLLGALQEDRESKQPLLPRHFPWWECTLFTYIMTWPCDFCVMVLIKIFENLIRQYSVGHVEVGVKKLLEKLPGHSVHTLTIFLLIKSVHNWNEGLQNYLPQCFHKHASTSPSQRL